MVFPFNKLYDYACLNKKSPYIYSSVGCLLSLLGCRSFGDGDTPEDGQAVSEIRVLATLPLLSAVRLC